MLETQGHFYPDGETEARETNWLAQDHQLVEKQGLPPKQSSLIVHTPDHEAMLFQLEKAYCVSSARQTCLVGTTLSRS